VKKLVALGLLAGLGFFVMTLPPSSYADIREGFLEGCSGGGDSEASCECLFNAVSASIPLEDFLVENGKMNSGEEPGEAFAKALDTAFTNCHQPEKAGD
jgi:hypothetical protein